MRTRLGAALVLFLSSYLPLALIQLIYNIDDKSWNAGICRSLSSCELPVIKNSLHTVAFLLATVFCTAVFVFVLGRIPSRYKAKVVNAKLIQSDFISYSLPYIVSFMSLDLSGPQRIAGFYLFMATLFWTNYKSGQLMLNPILIAFDWKLYEVDLSIDGHKRTHRMISKEKIIPGSAVNYSAVDEVLIRIEHVD